MIIRLESEKDKSAVSRAILEALPEWFGIEHTRENYIKNSAGQIMVADMENGKPRGFLCLKETGMDTVELAVMGVLKEHHRQGIGKRLFSSARDIAAKSGYSFMQVKTVKMGCYEEYDRTNKFYLSLGFKELEVFPELWDKNNPCQIYIMALR